ncbi:MAG TPA: alpha/beta fold hydrolase [Vicinamibacterales bacterium]|nr:alpha/beta fold hydrolase [Vicinamibacterales bacterium]
MAARTEPFEPQTEWLTIYEPRPRARLRLVCFPHAGSSAAAFAEWNRKVPHDIEVASVEYPGRGARRAERPFVRVRALVAAAFSGLRDALAEKPFALFGHSMGALIAFELARQFQRFGDVRPAALLVAACRAPGLPLLTAPVYQAPDAAFVAAVRALNGTDSAILDHPEFQRLFLPVLRADFEAAETYVRQGRDQLALPLFVYGGSADPEVPVDDLHAWSAEATVGATVRVYPGDHFFLETSRDRLMSDIAADVLSTRKIS